MPESQLITDIESAFKKKGLVKTAKEFADLIGENPNGLSDIKAGRKKLTIDHIKTLKKSHPELNLDWLLSGKGSLFLEENKAAAPNNDAAVTVERSELLKDLNAFRTLAIQQAEMILNLTRSQATKEA
jgi:transcriptional regulator with XRE-family HTH domain